LIKLEDLEEAIAECQGQREPNANTCIKLAAFYTIKREMFGDNAPIDPSAPDRGYSASAGPVNQQPETYVDFDSGTEFSRAIDGRDAYAAWEIMDELLSVLQATNPRLYDGVMRKIEEI
jgi:hypothetical protein